MSNKCPIGFFDSGVGGLSVYSLFKKLVPNENTIYFGDTKNLPYGDKTPEELVIFAKNILDFLKEKQVKAVVIACNTSSAIVYDRVKKSYDFPIFPIIQSCAKAIANDNIKRLGVFATNGTVKSKAYSREINKQNPKIEVKEIACPNWVKIVENGLINTEEAKSDIKIKLAEMGIFSPEKIILGCTHYPYLLNILKDLNKNNIFIDPAEIFVNALIEELKNKNLLNNDDNVGQEEFFVSTSPEQFVKNAKLFYDIKSMPKVV